ncbi:MAG: flagellar hook assembly protein FlgD [Steroidobacteraceae bacterium]
MTTVTSTGSTTNTTSTTAGKGMSSLGVNDFITLMTTQLKYQDPTKPQDSSAFVAQLAQFSSVSGIQEMNSSMASLLSEMRNSQAVNATSLVGHDVLVSGSSMTTTSAGQSVTGAIETPDNASNINVVITDKSGQVVRQMTVAAGSDLTSFTWDGLDDSGNQVAAGKYNFKAIANVAGQSVSADTLLSTKVASVTIDTTNNSLLLNTSSLGSIGLSDVRQVI